MFLTVFDILFEGVFGSFVAIKVQEKSFSVQTFLPFKSIFQCNSESDVNMD